MRKEPEPVFVTEVKEQIEKETEPVPEQIVTEPESTLGPDGHYVPLDKLSYMKIDGRARLKSTSIKAYTDAIMKLNVKLKEYEHLQDLCKTNLYWEKYCEDPIMIDIIKILHEMHKIDNSDDICQKVVPIMTCMNMIEGLPATCMAKWLSFKEQLRDETYYVDFCTANAIGMRKKDTSRSERDVPPWETLRARFEKVSTTNGLDYRVRAITAIYKYGYILRPTVLFRTRVFMETTEDPEYNYLNMETGEWIVNKSKHRIQTFYLPEQLMVELQKIVVKRHPFFAQGWLVAKDNGYPYKTECMKHVKQWTQLKLPDNVLCRKSFEDWHWYRSGVTMAEAKQMSQVLDHKVLTAVVYYTPAYNPEQHSQ